MHRRWLYVALGLSLLQLPARSEGRWLLFSVDFGAAPAPDPADLDAQLVPTDAQNATTARDTANRLYIQEAHAALFLAGSRLLLGGTFPQTQFTQRTPGGGLRAGTLNNTYFISSAFTNIAANGTWMDSPDAVLYGTLNGTSVVVLLSLARPAYDAKGELLYYNNATVLLPNAAQPKLVGGAVADVIQRHANGGLASAADGPGAATADTPLLITSADALTSGALSEVQLFIDASDAALVRGAQQKSGASPLPNSFAPLSTDTGSGSGGNNGPSRLAGTTDSGNGSGGGSNNGGIVGGTTGSSGCNQGTPIGINNYGALTPCTPSGTPEAFAPSSGNVSTSAGTRGAGGGRGSGGSTPALSQTTGSSANTSPQWVAYSLQQYGQPEISSHLCTGNPACSAREWQVGGVWSTAPGR